MGRKAGMAISELEVGDADRLRAMARKEKNAEQRDRLRAVIGALSGRGSEAIAGELGRTGRFVQKWAYRYRDGGIGSVARKFSPGLPQRLPKEQVDAFKARFKAAPTEKDGGVCTLRGKDAVRILDAEFGKAYSLGGAYQLLHRIGLSCLKPRPRHEKNDPQAMAQFKTTAPFLSGKSAPSTPAKKSRSGSRTKRDSASKGR